LIQVLSLDKHGHRSEEGLQRELQGNPKSANNWTHLALGHPEFFRVDLNQKNQLSLVARHVIESNENGSKEMPPDLIKTLIQIAIELHDRQKEKSERWKVWLPLIVVIITVLSSFYVQYDNNKNQSNLKHYEVELKPKLEGYTSFMKSISQSYSSAQSNDFEQMMKSLDRAEDSYFIIEPFLSNSDKDSIWANYQNFTSTCYLLSKSDSLRSDLTKSSGTFLKYKNFYRKYLYNALFVNEKSR
jgi:hypothetical protein